MKIFNIAISCIGCRGAQSIINACRLSGLPVKTVGFGTNPFAYGAYDCDMFDYTPSVFSDNYLDGLIQKCREHNIDLFIPMLEDEILLLAKNYGKLQKAGVNVIISDEEMVSVCSDKASTYRVFKDIADVFVENYNKETIEDDIKSGKVVFPFVAKPRKGAGAEGIEIITSESDLYKINEEHIIQEFAVPQKSDPNYEYFMQQISRGRNPQVSVISVQLVVGKKGQLLGRMSSYNKLKNGVAIEIVPYEDERVWNVVDELMPEFMRLGFKGPLNIEGIITDSGFKIFDLNPRFTDVSGLRALMGFNEVEACIRDWLDINTVDTILDNNKCRFGLRQFEEKAVWVDRNKDVELFLMRLNGRILKKRKTVLVTSASGCLGKILINSLAKDDEFEVYGLDIYKDEIKDVYEGDKVTVFGRDDLDNGRLSLGNIDVLVNLGFVDSSSGNDEIAGSIKFTGELFTLAARHNVPAIVNISSQNVYGLGSATPWTEQSGIAPQTLYAQAMYFNEVMLENLRGGNNQLRYTSLRMGALAGGQGGYVVDELIMNCCLQALRGEKIRIEGGDVNAGRLDVRDAARAIVAVLKTDSLGWNSVYNLGSAEKITAIDVAVKIADRVRCLTKRDTDIDVNIPDGRVDAGMDCSLFENDFCWTPEYNMDSIVECLIDYLKMDVTIEINSL